METARTETGLMYSHLARIRAEAVRGFVQTMNALDDMLVTLEEADMKYLEKEEVSNG